MKVAPEHVSDAVLSVMGKPGRETFEEFLRVFESLNRGGPEKRHLVRYFMTSHPGTGLGEALDLGQYCLDRGLHPEQVQDFIPLPMTLSAAMYHTGRNPLTGEPLHVPRTLRERKLQRALLQPKNASNRALVREALGKLGAGHLEKRFLGEAHRGGPPGKRPVRPPVRKP